MTLPDFAPVILVLPSVAAARTAFGVAPAEDGATPTDDLGQVPNVPWWRSRRTPPIWKMINGTPYVDADTGLTVTPRVRDQSSTKLAIVAVMDTTEALALKAKFPTNVFLYRPQGLANAQAAHPELDWPSLGEIWGWKVA